MWKGARLYVGVLSSLKSTRQCRRTFLSEAYLCNETWNKRLESPILKNINNDNFFFELDQRLSREGTINSVDLDIFANTCKEEHNMEELADLLHRARQTIESTYTLDSTHHAVVRFFLDQGDANFLLDILHDRLNYGIFPNDYTLNILMDELLKKGDFGNAARAASLPMLQEEHHHPIVNSMALYACHKYLDHQDQWVVEKEEPVEIDEDEVVKVRVKFLRSPWFDDHFDLTEPKDLVGKTLSYIGKYTNTPAGRSCHLRGLIVYRKYKQALDLINQWKEKCPDPLVCEDVFELIERDLSEVKEPPEDEISALKNELNSLKSKNLSKDKLEVALERELKEAVAKQQAIDTVEQEKLIKEWENVRVARLDDQVKEIKKQQAMRKIEEMKRNLKDKERLLTFYEKEEDIELELDRLKEIEENRYAGHPLSKHPYLKQKEEDYRPPMI